ncbi:MAG: D-hexose-6-phosphate mutarotase [bacterium]
MIHIATPDGSEAATLCQAGAQLLSWHGADGRDRLFLSRRAEFAPGMAIRGGVPVIFPQFGDGPLPKHGLARTRPWRQTRTAPDQAEFTLDDDAATRAIWPHRFRLGLTARISAGRLSVRLTVENCGEKSFPFTCALHSYFAVADIRQTTVAGLAGLPFLDSLRDDAQELETRELIPFTGEVDRIYVGAPDQGLSIRDAGHGRSLMLEKCGMPDAVLWNPWREKARQLPDFLPEEYRRMVCLETGIIAQPHQLAPGAVWVGETGFKVT